MEKTDCSRCGITITADDFSDFWVNFSLELHEACMKCSLKFLKHTQNLKKAEVLKWLYSDCDPTELREWINTFEKFEDAIIWRNEGFSPRLAESWSEVTAKSTIAQKWHSLGFTPGTAKEWITWGCTPQLADELISLNDDLGDEAPPIEYRSFGFSLQEAFLLHSEGISLDEECGPENSLNTWISSGLNAEQIIVLRNEIIRRLENLEENRFKYQITKIEFWKSAPQTFAALRLLGLPIDINNVMKFWGIKANQILKLIDLGEDSEITLTAVRHGVSIDNLKHVEKFMGDGFDRDFAIKVVGRGILPKHQLIIKRNGWNFQEIYRLLESDPAMHIDEALNWRGSGIVDIQSWKTYGFTAESALKWKLENFRPDEAQAWELSGVKSPSVANRRKAAGIQP